MRHGRVLPKGSGGVMCSTCNAKASADGKGSPIVLMCEWWCEDGHPIRKVQRKIVEEAIPEWEWKRDDVVAFGCEFSGYFYDLDNMYNACQFVVHVRRVDYLPKDGIVPYDPEGRRKMETFVGVKAMEFMERLMGIK